MEIVDYNVDDERTQKLKFLEFDVTNMEQLKKAGLWWEEDERKFYNKYSKSSEEVAQRIRDYFKKGIK